MLEKIIETLHRQDQHSGSSTASIKKSCFSKTAGGGTAKTDESRFSHSKMPPTGTDETDKNLEKEVSSVLTVPLWPVCEITGIIKTVFVALQQPDYKCDPLNI